MPLRDHRPLHAIGPRPASAYGRAIGIALLLVGSLLAGGCGTGRMIPGYSDAPLVAGRARVVFLRPSFGASAINWALMDGDGKFVGDICHGCQFSVDVDQGRHVYICWAENSPAVVVDAVAGSTYLVLVSPRLGAFSARAQMFAVKPGSAWWDKRQQWLAQCTRYTPDTVAGQADFDRRPEDIADRKRRGLATLAEYTPDQLAERTLAPVGGD